MLGRKDLLFGAHAALVVAFGIGQGVRSLQEAGFDRGAGFASTTLGRSAALVAMLLGIPALAAVLGLTIAERRDVRFLVLFLLLVLALVDRDGFDVLDLIYLAAATGAIVFWVARGHRR